MSSDTTATDLRCGGVSWGDDELALVYESWWKTRRSVIHTIAPSRPQDGMQVGLLPSLGSWVWLQLLLLPACTSTCSMRLHVTNLSCEMVLRASPHGCLVVKKDKCAECDIACDMAGAV